MLLTNRWLSCKEALRINLINRMVPKGEHVKAAEEMAGKIAKLNPNVVRQAKQAIMRGLDLPLTEGLETEQRLVIQD